MKKKQWFKELTSIEAISDYGKAYSRMLSKPFEIYAPNSKIHIPGRIFKSIYCGSITVPKSFVLLIDSEINPECNFYKCFERKNDFELDFINRKQIIFKNLKRDFGYTCEELEDRLEYWPFLMAASNSVHVKIENRSIVSYSFCITYKGKTIDTGDRYIDTFPFLWRNQ